jgi:hypothetical protein
MSANDDLKIFYNLMAQSDSGINDPMLIGKFSKAKAQLHAMDSYKQMQAMNNSPMMANQSATDPNANQVDTSTPLGQNLPQDAQSQPSTQGQPQVGKYDNL